MSKFYKCYSIRLKNFLGVNGVRYITKGYNKKTKKQFWTFIKNDELCDLLTQYTAIFDRNKESQGSGLVEE